MDYLIWMKRQSRRYPWQSILPVVFYLLLLSVLLQTTFLQLHRRWVTWDGPYSHGYVLVGVCLIVVLYRLPALVAQSTGSLRYLPVLCFPALLWSFGYATQTGVLEQVALPLFVIGLLLVLLGYRPLRQIIFPLTLMFLAIPLWEILLPALRILTSAVVTWAIKLMGIPVFIDGFSFSLPYGTVVIAGSCAGLNYFLMGLVLSSLNALIRGYDRKYAAISILLLMGLSILGNWLRVFSLILIAYYSNMQSSLVSDHGTYGWLIFASIFIIYLCLIRHFPERTFVLPESLSIKRADMIRLWQMTLLVCGVSLVLPLLLIIQPKNMDDQQRSPSLNGLVNISEAAAVTLFKPHITGYDKAEFWQGTIDRQSWTVGRLTFLNQRQGKELVVAGRRLFDDNKGVESTTLTLSNGRAVKLVIHRGSYHQWIVWGYLIGDRVEIAPVRAKIRQFYNDIQGKPLVGLFYAETRCLPNSCESMLTANDAVLLSWIDSLKYYNTEH